jgi:thymidylate kinase
MSSNPTTETPLFKIFSLLEKANVSYCVLRSYEGLPYTLNGSDLDVLVDNIDIFLSFLKEAIKSLNLVVICQYWSSSSFFRICLCGDYDWGLQIDIHIDETYRGLSYYDYRELLQRSVNINKVSVCCAADSAILSLLKETLSNGKSKKDYAAKAERAYLSNPTYYKDHLKKYFGKYASAKWDNYFRADVNKGNLKKIALYSRTGLFLNSFKHAPLKTILCFVKYQRSRWSRLFKPPGFSVAFIGADGAGKSTIIKEIRPQLESALHSKILYEHLRPNLFPSLASLFGRNVKDEPVINPHAAAPSNFIGSLLRLMYYSMDYIIGYWFKIYPEMVKRPCIWIFDRYFYDYHFDSTRSRILLPEWLIRFFSLIIPKPDLVIFLGTDPVIIHHRKPELSIDEIKRQLTVQKIYYKKAQNAVWIDTGTDIKITKEKVLTAITKVMSKRYKE